MPQRSYIWPRLESDIVHGPTNWNKIRVTIQNWFFKIDQPSWNKIRQYIAMIFSYFGVTPSWITVPCSRRIKLDSFICEKTQWLLLFLGNKGVSE